MMNIISLTMLFLEILTLLWSAIALSNHLRTAGIPLTPTNRNTSLRKEGEAQTQLTYRPPLCETTGIMQVTFLYRSPWRWEIQSHILRENLWKWRFVIKHRNKSIRQGIWPSLASPRANSIAPPCSKKHETAAKGPSSPVPFTCMR